MNYEVIICFETHVELNTKTKLFCNCPVGSDAPPNSLTCPVCTGQPGALPVLNKKAVEYSIKAGLALNCTINTLSRFARKNYFYPDLPKGYQISQYENPFCEDGHLEIQGDDGQPYTVGIKRIHLEEDAGKLTHSSGSFESSDYSLVDYNRSSVPLLEIVGDHQRNPLRSVGEARTYLEKLRQILRYTGISDCILEKGQFRCDVNISVRPIGVQTFGDRAEIKNMSSFRFIADALEYEIKRQQEVLEAGGHVKQETRLFDEGKKITLPMRSKEDAPDYRYFPDPDLVEVEIDREFLDEIRERIPELPDQKVGRLMEAYGVSKNDALFLTRDRSVSAFFESCAQVCGDKKKLTDWIARDLFSLLNDASLPMESCPVRPEDFARLIDLLTTGDITERIGRVVLREMFETEKTPETIIKEKGLTPIEDDHILGKILDEVMAENPEAVESLKEGKKEAMNFLIGQVMKKTKGRAHGGKLSQMIRKKIFS